MCLVNSILLTPCLSLTLAIAFANFALNSAKELAYYPNAKKPTIFAEFQVSFGDAGPISRLRV